ncbi:hypothetical protein AKJ09_07082 [Labilithrix luteola]|uniref:Uncharacterized protein n=1 Tax=Labilithrix luteola TaxID=1391654 RepID=A0A0K1Q3W3_9BACT|nr:hypothetical protein [Labilithrix luteola]AKV00419.1 hypothetical protein AKJ09_07082 [Labilithrix luteola]
MLVALMTSGAGERSAQAQVAEHERIQVRYDAHASCPPEGEFVGNVRRYTSRWALADESVDARRFHVTLEPRGDEFVGTLAIAPKATSGTDEVATREIVGPDCDVVARGMAVAMAVAIDPQALFGSDSTSNDETGPGPVEEAPTPIKPTAPPRERPVRTLPPAPRAPLWDVEARVEMTSAVVTGWLPVFGAAIAIDPLASRAKQSSWTLPRWVRPSIAIGIRQSLPKDVTEDSIATTFSWTAGNARLCPVRFASSNERLEVLPCFEADIGSLHAEASGSQDARSSTKAWVDVGGSARIRWQVSGPWFIGSSAMLVAPISRNRFELATGALVSRAPGIGVSLGLTGGARF